MRLLLVNGGGELQESPGLKRFLSLLKNIMIKNLWK